jgi:hypothetical protein
MTSLPGRRAATRAGRRAEQFRVDLEETGHASTDGLTPTEIAWSLRLLGLHVSEETIIGLQLLRNLQRRPVPVVVQPEGSQP